MSGNVAVMKWEGTIQTWYLILWLHKLRHNLLRPES